MNAKKILLLTVIGLFIPFLIKAQDSARFKIDLSVHSKDTLSFEVSKNKEFKVKVINQLPWVNYTFSIKRIANDIPVISTVPDIDVSSLISSSESVCDSLNQEVIKLYDAQSEVMMAKGIRDMEVKLTLNSCSKETLNQLKQHTSFPIPSFSIKRGEKYLITIYRVVNDDSLKTWNYELKGPSRGTWDVSYGFTFGMNVFTKEGAYHLSGSDSSYTISESSTSNLMDLIPSIFFTWKPQPNNPVSIGVTGGLGINSDSPSVFLGPSVTFQRNVSLSAGIAAYKVKNLHGKYEVGQIITELLDDDQLHAESYHFNPYVTLTFRFDQSPFGKGE